MKQIFFLILIFFAVETFAQSLDQDLLVACYENNEKAVFDLIRRGANVNAQTDKNVTPLMYSVQNGNYLICKKLLNAGANPDAMSRQNPPVLNTALMNNDTAIVYLLLENNANPNIVEIKSKKYPLLYSIDANNYVLTDLLLWYGANPNLIVGKNLPLLDAIQNNSDTSIVNLLIQYGADVNIQNSFGYTPLIEATFYNNLQIAEILLKAGAKPQIKDSTTQEFTALDYALKYHLSKITALLLPYTDNPDKYHNQALRSDNLLIAKQIRQNTGQKFLSPILTKVYITPQVLFSYNDLFLGGKIGFFEARYNFETNFGIMPRLFRRRILIEQSPHNYLQVWEKRTMLIFEINKNFNLFYGDEHISGMYIKLGGNYSFGDYKGINYSYQKPFVPSAGIGIWSQKKHIRMKLGYEYLPIQTNFPHFITMGMTYTIPFM